MNFWMRKLAGATLLMITVSTVASAADLTIAGTAPKPQAWSVPELKQAAATAIKPIDYDSHGSKHHANAIPLTTLLELAGVDLTMAPAPNVPPARKHPPLRWVAIIRGNDGYAVAFSVAELLPSTGNHEAWLALDLDDQPLPASEGPLKLLVPNDAGPARSVRTVREIDLVDLSAPTTQPANGH